MTTMSTNGTLPEWSGPTELAQWLQVSVQTVYDWNSKGTGPQAHKIGRHLRFRRADVERWLGSRTIPQGAA